MQLVDLEKESIDKFNELKSIIDGVISQSPEQVNFLSYLIKKYRPVKVLELGVASGASSIVILSTLKDVLNNYHLYSIDYLSYWYADPNKKTGFLVEEKTPELIDNWTLKTGNFACEFMDQICPNNIQDIDFCFIDTMHMRPGEILDFLMVLPYLKKNAVVVFHDTVLQTFGEKYKNHDVNCILYSAIKGIKYQPLKDASYPSNIGAVILDENIKENLYDIFSLLLLSWFYKIDENEYIQILHHFERHYDSCLIEIYKQAYYYNSSLIDKRLKNDKLTNKDICKMYKYMLLSKLGIKKYKEKLDKYKERIWVTTKKIIEKELILS